MGYRLSLDKRRVISTETLLKNHQKRALVYCGILGAMAGYIYFVIFKAAEGLGPVIVRGIFSISILIRLILILPLAAVIL
jgi:hypothetical protein